MKTILISGGDGCYAKKLKECNTDYKIISPSKSDMDITDVNKLDHILSSTKPDYFIHAGAFVRPMKLHKENPEKSIMVNIMGTSNVVLACMKYKVKLIFISTDFVYPGDKGGYSEDDALLPVNKYAWSKLGGECAVKLYDNSLILRISMTNNPFTHSKALVDCYRSLIFDDDAAELTLSLLDEFGTINVGGDPKSIYEFMQGHNPCIEKTYLSEIKNVNMPNNVTLNLDKLKGILKK